MCLQNYTIKLFQGNLNNLFVCSEFYKNKSEQKIHCVNALMSRGKYKARMGKGIIIDIVAMLFISVLSVSVRCTYERKDL